MKGLNTISLFFSLFFLLIQSYILAQKPGGALPIGKTISELILVKGILLDAAAYTVLPYSMVVNKNTSVGIFTDMDGTFSLQLLKTDTVLISARGYSTRKICFKDSLSKAVYEIEVIMQKLSVNLKEVEIFPQRKIEEIESDITKMKEFDKNDFMLHGFNAIRSPITYFYQVYSKKENSKRRVAELMLEDSKREIIKELLRMYVNGNLIHLEEKEFDDFTDFCNVDINFLKNCTQYEFIMFIKKKYADYLRLPKK